jgi:hypothetical protein
MTSTIRERILEQIQTNLSGIVGVVTIARERPEPFARDECPAINIEPGVDTPEQITVPRTYWTLNVKLAVQLRDEQQYSAADPIIASIHSRLCTDRSVSGLAVDINPGEVHFSRFDGDATVCIIDLNYEVQYITSASDLTV